MITQSVYQLKIELQGAHMPVWRRFLVPSDITLGTLHDVVQAVMGWGNSHLHTFEFTQGTYSTPFQGVPGSTPYGARNGGKKKLNDLVDQPHQCFEYLYDFGDSWEHVITLEKVLDNANHELPICLKVVGRCPPEDCGGVYGYEELLDTLSNPGKEYHEDMMDWMGLEPGERYDPEEVDMDAINKELTAFRTKKRKKEVV